MFIVKERSLKKLRAERVEAQEKEYLITDLEIGQIEQEQKMTDMEIDILELQLAIMN